MLRLGVDEAGRVLVEGRHQLAQAAALLKTNINYYFAEPRVSLINIGN